MMRTIAAAGVALSAWAGLQTPALNPLSADEIAIYRAVLHRAKEGNGDFDKFYLANKTEPVRALLQADSDCANGLDLELSGGPAGKVTALDPEVELYPRFVLVDADMHEEKIRENDPENLIRRALAEGKKVDGQQIRASLQRAFESGLYTLSAIVFDRERRHAVVAFAFRCGMLCGYGATFIMEKADDSWVVSKVCEQWIS